VTLMTFDKQSNCRRIEIEYKSNRSCNHGIRLYRQQLQSTVHDWSK